MSKNNYLSGLKRKYQRLAGSTIEYDLAPYQKILKEINALSKTCKHKSSTELRKSVDRIRGKAAVNEDTEALLPEIFALVREAVRRTLRITPYDVQMLGTIAMNSRKIAEMQTGEGKTLTAVFTACLQALSGRGVHILTFNDYLAKRDAAWMGPVYEMLGFTTGYIQNTMSGDERKKAYAADITYVTAKEAGFDYLRSFLCYDAECILQRPFHCCIVDEADSILIDEARIPLVIAGNVESDTGTADSVHSVAQEFVPGVDFSMDEYQRNIILTEEGVEKSEHMLSCDNLYDPRNITLLTAVHNALHAEHLLHRDVDYIVRNNSIELVDEFTGRIVKDRHWPDGLQAALESKENIPHRQEGTILGSITLRHFITLYPCVCGMTATACQSAEEFKEFYNLDVVVIPPNRTCSRIDRPDVIFTHREAKFKAVVEEIKTVHSLGRPVLCGTVSVEESETFAEALRESGIKCTVLNAKNDEQEAEIIAGAGAPGAVTISTNMAGRGTDIKLGGADEEEREKVTELGGLYVIGTNRHESLRIDRQLRGRAGRQGDPGESRFFISLEDGLVVQYGIDNLIPERFRPDTQEGEVDNPVIRREIGRVQRIIEGQNFDIRKELYKYSEIIEHQRKLIQQERQDILCGKSSYYSLRHNIPDSSGSAPEIKAAQKPTISEKIIILNRIDHHWSSHLAYIAHLREGIHLVAVGGRNPLDEFLKLAADAFREMRKRIAGDIEEALRAAAQNPDKNDSDSNELRGPSSTWTYLVNDDAFQNSIASMIGGQGGSYSGFAVGAAFMWPLFILSALIQKVIGKRIK